VVPLAAPLAVLQAEINAAAALSPRSVCAFDVVSKIVKDDALYEIKVGLNRWSGVFSGQGFRSAGQRAQRGVSN